MECPPGMNNRGKDDCIILQKCIYNFVQAARQYYKRAIDILKSISFSGGNVDLCLYRKQSARVKV